MEEADLLSMSWSLRAYSSNVAARSVEARSITVLDQIEAIGRYDRNRRGGGLCRLYRAGPASGNDYRRLTVYQTVGEHRQLPESQVRPAKFDGNILSGFFEALPELDATICGSRHKLRGRHLESSRWRQRYPAPRSRQPEGFASDLAVNVRADRFRRF